MLFLTTAINLTNTKITKNNTVQYSTVQYNKSVDNKPLNLTSQGIIKKFEQELKDNKNNSIELKIDLESNKVIVYKNYNR